MGVNRRLDVKTELLKLEGAGFTRPEIIDQLSEKFHVSPRTIRYYYRTRYKWQPEITGLASAKAAYHQALNRLEHIYRKFSLILLQASEDNAKIGALKGMLETQWKKAMISGVLTPNTATEESHESQDLAYDEALKNLTLEEQDIVIKAVEVVRRKREQIQQHHNQENERVSPVGS
jgi:hypothetical protein